jgi:hypothetical protein
LPAFFEYLRPLDFRVGINTVSRRILVLREKEIRQHQHRKRGEDVRGD